MTTDQPQPNKFSPRLKDSVITRITNNEVKPYSYWRFRCIRCAFITLVAVSMIVGSVAVAVGLFTILNAGWEYYEMMHSNSLTFAVAALPYVWILLILATVVVGSAFVRRTGRGYRYAPVKVALILVALSVGGGIGLHIASVGDVVDRQLSVWFPSYYRSSVMHQTRLWHDPAQGRLAGIVIDTALENGFTFRDVENSEWYIFDQGLRHYDSEHITKGQMVRMVAVIDTESRSAAGCIVVPIGVQQSSMTAIYERRDQFKKRIKEAMRMPIPMATSSLTQYQACHALLKSLLPEAK